MTRRDSQIACVLLCAPWLTFHMCFIATSGLFFFQPSSWFLRYRLCYVREMLNIDHLRTNQCNISVQRKNQTTVCLWRLLPFYFYFIFFMFSLYSSIFNTYHLCARVYSEKPILCSHIITSSIWLVHKQFFGCKLYITWPLSCTYLLLSSHSCLTSYITFMADILSMSFAS